MARKLPPLHLIHIFEASARHQSFKLASEELFLSPSAISHQIKSLETYLGFNLFYRKSRKVELNAAGKMFLGYVQQSLQILDQGTSQTINRFTSPILKISTFPTMASNVIIPQLELFQSAHPDIDIKIETGLNLHDLRHDDIDLALRLGNGDWPNVGKKKLMEVEISVLCSPSFAKKHNLTSVKQISNLPLIDLSNMENIWKRWTKGTSVKQFNSKHKLTFNSYESSIQAACQGLGLVLAMLPIENALIRNNLLMKPFDISMPFTHSLYAVYRQEDANRHDITCFLDWLMQSPNLA